MIIFPAIDIKDGKCVRLTRGDFDTVEQVADNALETARGFRAAGAQWIHMVDLDGAALGRRVNATPITQVARESGLAVEFGGGIRDMASVEYYLTRGISRVILGSAALHDPDFMRAAVRRHGERIAAGIDAMNGRVRTAGWRTDGGTDYITLAKRMEDMGVRTIIFTDISKDGALSGPNFEQLKALRDAVSCDIIASGGITDAEDVRRLARMGLYGAILGKALYKGRLTLREAIAEAAVSA
ncbi:MAG: 1-(5-phosphoribosyl)-5-[(5-phosphoribosylamino)methylideneamino]imidazole-4-carboxamide isomerase [Clostridiales Family XIII bacterium]|jgi:phosphoribosylformimino-5-aminoimidazole carboxamide ribotide isomerase|nr:1-(5-phosphoribosyl)-5-[(5-phosphoribosylamino)methylideneamino]imidazole-4-carboxamide isomerase [Clostridiales Family XIII bacterium]